MRRAHGTAGRPAHAGALRALGAAMGASSVASPALRERHAAKGSEVTSGLKLLARRQAPPRGIMRRLRAPSLEALSSCVLLKLGTLDFAQCNGCVVRQAAKQALCALA